MSTLIKETYAADPAAESHDEEVHEEVAVEADNPIAALTSQFGLDGQIFAAQLVNFLVVLVILWRFVYRPVVNMLDERSEKIEKSVKKAEEIERRMESIDEERANIVKEAQKEAQAIIEEAHAKAEKRREELVDDAKRQVERVIAKGKDQLAEEKTSMMREMRKDIIDIAVKAVARVLDEQIDEKKSQSLAEEVVRKMT